MQWNKHSNVPDGAHAFLSPSTYSWLNYTDEHLLEVYGNRLAVARGTALHELAKDMIKLKVLLPKDHKTLNMYVNDAIKLKMVPEQKLYYSEYCFGTADAIVFDRNRVLRIHDLKTGKTKASFNQLRIYAALFFLEYNHYKVGDAKKIELRIYQNDDVRIEEDYADDILPIMDRIVHCDRLIRNLEEKYDDGNITLWSRS